MKNIIYTALIFSSFNLWAMECAPQVEVSSDIENLLKGVKEKKRDWFAASEEKVLKAPCRKNYPSLADQELYLKSLVKGMPTRFKKIGDVELEDSPAMIALYKELTTYTGYADPPPEENQNLGAKNNIGPDCKKVVCALGKVFGDKRAKEMLYMKQKFGINISPLTNQNRQNFSENEMDQIKKAVMDFPSHLMPLDENRSCTRLHKEYSLGLGVLANATITFANDWNEYGPGLMQATVLHEMSHNFGSDKNLDEDKDWLAASGWIKKGDDWTFEKDTFVSDYAASNPHEDFAETCVAYRYDPEKLKKISPEKFKFLKERVFGGIEYSNAQMCQESNLEVSKAISKIKPSLATFDVSSIDPHMRENLVSYCPRDSLQVLLDSTYRPYQECIEGAIALELAKKQIQKDNPTLSPEKIDANLFGKLNGRSAKDSFGINFSEDQKKQIAKYSMKMMDDYELDAYQKITVYGEFDNKEAYCSEFASEYSYQNFSQLDKNIKNQFLLFNRSKDISEVVHGKCMRVQSSFSKYRPFTKSDLPQLLR